MYLSIKKLTLKQLTFYFLWNVMRTIYCIKTFFLFANFDPRKIREQEHNRLQVNVLKYIFFLESLVSMKMFDTELQVYLNRWFFFLLKLATKTCLSYKGDVVPTVYFYILYGRNIHVEYPVHFIFIVQNISYLCGSFWLGDLLYV